jgi:hypothetical protein
MEPMLSTCNASSPSDFDAAFDKVKVLLSNDPKKLDFVQDYSDQPHRFAAYCIDAVPGPLGRRGSVASEQNHSIVSAHLGDHIFEPEAQVASLLTPQSELSAKKHSSDQQYSYFTCFFSITSLPY